MENNLPASFTEKMTERINFLADPKIAIPVIGLLFWGLAKWLYPTWYFDEQNDVEDNINTAARWIAVINMIAVATILWAVNSSNQINNSFSQEVIGGAAPF
jgi:hypothetical protein